MPIGELSRRIGVSPDLLRKWEHRYAVLSPERTTGNQRLYSRVDEARARVMLGHVRDGMAAAQAAELAIGARFRITSKVTATTTATGPEQVAQSRAAMQTALERYDETTAEQALGRLLAASNATTVIRDVFLPYLHDVGQRWEDRHLSIAQAHFATAFVHSRLLGLARGWDRGLGPRALLACPPDEHHTFGLIAFGIGLHQLGWRITYLGPNTPVSAIAEAASGIRPRLTVITATVPHRLDPFLPELQALSSRWSLAIAGAGTDPQLAIRSGARHLPGDPITAAESMLGEAPHVRVGSRHEHPRLRPVRRP